MKTMVGKDGRKLGVIQIDLDSLYHLLKIYGYNDPPAASNASLYRKGIFRFKRLLDNFGIKATFMVVGDDIKDKENQKLIEQLARENHEIANHTMTHPLGFGSLNAEIKRKEIEEASSIIKDTTGVRPVGFRAPGYEIDSSTIEILKDLGYEYDSSIFPSYLNMGMKLYYRLLALGRRPQSSKGLGGFKLSFAPNTPYFPGKGCIWRKMESGKIVEIPITTVPLLKLPFYSNFHMFTGVGFFRASLALSKTINCNYLFHGIDLLDPGEMDKRILKHPNASKPIEKKFYYCQYFLKSLSKHYNFITAREFAARFQEEHRTKKNI